jgi:GGDEF domain-containing protein
VCLLGAFQDITEKKNNALELHRLNEELTRLSTTDALTEVGNRRLFDQTLKSEWLRAARRQGPIGLLMIDVDHFKEYNDHYGHPAGDAVLRQIARMVGESVRRGGELVARYGGEEFALLLPGADLEAACADRRALPPARHRRQDRAPRLDDVGVARRQHRRRQPGGDAERRLRRPGRDRRRGALSRPSAAAAAGSSF